MKEKRRVKHGELGFQSVSVTTFIAVVNNLITNYVKYAIESECIMQHLQKLRKMFSLIDSNS